MLLPSLNKSCFDKLTYSAKVHNQMNYSYLETLFLSLIILLLVSYANVMFKMTVYLSDLGCADCIDFAREDACGYQSFFSYDNG